MATVLDDVTSETIDASDIQRRISNWEERLNELYKKINDWLPEDWQGPKGSPVNMHEKLMKKFRIEPTQVPTFVLSNGSNETVTIEPYGLWIIGVNGRVDMKRGDNHYLLVDVAENFNPPEWYVAKIDRRERRDRIALTESWLRQVLQ